MKVKSKHLTRLFVVAKKEDVGWGFAEVLGEVLGKGPEGSAELGEDGRARRRAAQLTPFAISKLLSYIMATMIQTLATLGQLSLQLAIQGFILAVHILYNALDFFKLFFTVETIKQICKHSNKYGWMVIEKKKTILC